jgi:dipeptidase D
VKLLKNERRKANDEPITTTEREPIVENNVETLKRILKHFEAIRRIPHCSREAEALRGYLEHFGRTCGYDVLTDAAGNLLMRKGSPGLCLQAHYDMVCVGRAPEIETVEIGGWLQAKESSLGADNGMAVAMMMALMEDGEELEFLLTADEEVGLVGAKALEFELCSRRLLNLDTEEAGEVYIGCAGGVDLVAEKWCAVTVTQDDRPLWRVKLSGFPGGHSGVDIDKGIPNAIKELAGCLLEREGLVLVDFQGGERRNSIPSSAEALVCYKGEWPEREHLTAERIDDEGKRGIPADSHRLLQLLAAAPHGVVSINEELDIPDSSLNLAIVKLGGGECRIDYSLRAMSGNVLEELAVRTETILERYGFSVRREDAYPAWRPDIDDFSRLVRRELEAEFGHSGFRAIHAGLECGILKEKYPGVKMASIGPTIEYPHSTGERAELASVERTFRALKRIIQRVES